MIEYSVNTVAQVIINRPEHRNATNLRMARRPWLWRVRSRPIHECAC